MSPSAALRLLALAPLPSLLLGFQGTLKAALEAGGQASGEAAWPPRCLWGPESDGRHSARCQAVYDLALEEYGKPAENVSTFGCNVPKVPYAWVEEIQAMNHTKMRNYNFMGAHQWSLDRQAIGIDWPQFSARNWVLDFAQANFSDEDYFRMTDVREDYEPMAPWDHSTHLSFDSHGAHGKKGDELEEYQATFDKEFFEIMSQSNFTLCPGGDMPWSMRFYEAIASGSIPIIEAHKYDLSAPHLWALWEIPYKYYVLNDGHELVYRQDWVDHNFDLFVKYQTFHYGDLEPPAQEQKGA